VIVLDTGPLVALVDADDDAHHKTRAWFKSAQSERLFIPGPVLGEAWYLVGNACGPAVEAQFLADLAHGAYGEIVVPGAEELRRAGDLVIQYADLPLGGTDACVIALAERLGATSVATLDRRHFTVVRPRHISALTLLPE
jgi:uncharacterized protein